MRTNKEQVGKGYALDWMFSQMLAQEKQYDAFVVFDADNLVHPEFLREMNNHLCKGEKVIQGYMDSKNPTDSWIAGTFSIAFWLINHMWHLAKYNIGLSTALGGTGMCIATEIVRKYGWGCDCLTEDMEFSMKVLLEGVRTCWAHDAIIYDEKVVGFMQSCRQRKRWAQGQCDCGERFIPKLFARGIKTGNIRMLDGIITLSQPFFMMASTIYAVLASINSYLPFYTNILNAIVPEPQKISARGISGFQPLKAKRPAARFSFNGASPLSRRQPRLSSSMPLPSKALTLNVSKPDEE